MTQISPNKMEWEKKNVQTTCLVCLNICDLIKPPYWPFLFTFTKITNRCYFMTYFTVVVATIKMVNYTIRIIVVSEHKFWDSIRNLAKYDECEMLVNSLTFKCNRKKNQFHFTAKLKPQFFCRLIPAPSKIMFNEVVRFGDFL